MSRISIPVGHVTVRVFMDGTEVSKGTRFSSLDSAINFFGCYRVRESASRGVVLVPNHRDLVEAGVQPAFSVVNFYDMHGAHIDASVVAVAAAAIVSADLRSAWPFRPTFPFSEWLPYGFRKGPVPGLHRGFRGRARWLRSPKTAQELRENNFADYDDDLIEAGIIVNKRRKYPSLPTRRDDIYRSDRVKSWKHQRSNQWRVK